VLAFVLLETASSLYAATVTASWNANPEPDIAGYRLSYGTQSGVYTAQVDVGNVTSWPLTLTGGVTYFFVVDAYDTAGLVSPNSAEISFAVPLPPGIASLAPASGFIATPIAITGTNFGATQGSSTVTVGGIAAMLVSWSDTSIVVTVPIGATTGNVVVTVMGVATNAVPFTVNIPVITADAVSPNAGTGASQTFALQYSDTAGATDVATTWVWFSATSVTAVNSCLVYYDRGAGKVSLLNDAGTQWMSGILGNAGSLQNQQCTVALGGSSTVALSGNTLIVNLAMTFAGGFNGPKNVYMFANGPNASSGWQTRGTWTVPAGPVTADSVSPAAGTGASQTFALQYSDTAGAADLATAWVWFDATFAASAVNSCLVYYDRGTNKVWLLNDAASQWTPGTVGSSSSLQNKQCAVTLGSSTTVALSGNILTLNLAMTFFPGFAGAQNVYMFAANTGGITSGWQTRGAWTVPGGTVLVTADTVTPSTGVGASQTFALQYSDTASALDLTTEWVWFNATFASSAANSCLIYYDRGANMVWLLNDAGTQWMPGTVGSSGVLQNTQCAVALGNSTTVALSGNALTVNLAMTFTGFSGAKTVYMFAENGAGTLSGWQTRGTWMVP
jgi:uncharacterized membrane protein